MAVSKSIIVVGVVAVLGAGGWYAWQNYGDMLLGKETKVAKAPLPPKPAAKPGAPADSSKMGAGTNIPPGSAAPMAGNDKLIDDLLTASGYKHMANELPGQILAGAASANLQKGQASIKSAELEGVLKEVFTSKGYIDRGIAELKKNFDEKKMKAALEMVSNPLSKRMTELEKARPTKADMEAFAAQPPTAQRMDLIRKIDGASKSTELASQMAFASARAVAGAAAANDPKKLAKIDSEIEQARVKTIETLRNNVLGSMALIYRKASDADLTEYVKLLNSDIGRWLNSMLSAAILEETKVDAAKVGEKIAALGKAQATPNLAKSAGPTVVETSHGNSATKDQKPLKTAAADGGARRGSRSGQDARACLDLPSNVEIIKCAEEFR